MYLWNGGWIDFSPLCDVSSGCTYEKLSKHCSSSLNLHFCLYRSSVRLTSNTLSRLLSILSVVSLWQGSALIPSRISLSSPLDRTVPPHGCSSTQSGLCHQHVLLQCWGIFALHIDHATDLTPFDAVANIKQWIILKNEAKKVKNYQDRALGSTFDCETFASSDMVF